MDARVFAKIRKFPILLFLENFCTLKNEEKNDIRGATNGAQFIFLSNFQRKSITSIGLCRIVPFIP